MSTLSGNKIRFLTILALSVLAIGALAARALSTQAGVPAALTGDTIGKVARNVLEDTENGQRTSIVILLSDQADVSKAYSMRDQDARGWYVYNTLRTHAEQTQAPLKAFLAARGVTYQSYWAANMLAVTADRGLVDALAARSDVRIIESNKPSRWIEPDDFTKLSAAPESPSVVEWGVQNVNAPQVWALGYTGTGMVVGNQDTGMRWEHNALKPKYRGWNGVSADHNYNWWDSIHSGGGACGPNSLVPCDDHSHGSHTTGTTVGDDGAGNQIGVAPGAKWMGCRNMNVGVGTPTTYTECFQFFIAPTDLAGSNPNPALRPHVMNNSWGCPTSEGCAANTLQAIVESSQASGIFVVASAGNSGSACSTVTDPPAIYAASFSVGAISSANALASFSSRGPVTVDGSGRMKPEIAAPGVNVRSATNTSNSAYANFQGTSMAGPHVVGVVALLWDAHPQLERMITETKQILINTANPSVTVSNGTSCGGTPIPNNHFGYGRVDALAAVNSVSGGTATPTVAVPSPTSCVPGTPVWVAGPEYTPGVQVVRGAVASNGMFYVAGGQDALNNPVNVVKRYDPGTNSWSTMAPLPVAVGQAPVVITGTKMYVAGGYIGSNTVTSTLQIYDITSNTWSFGASMPGITEASAGAIIGNKMSVIGGDDFNVGLDVHYVYDVGTNSWTTAAVLPAVRTNINATTVGGLLYVFGGATGGGFNADDDLLSYNPGTNSWTNLAQAGLTDLGNWSNITPYTAGNLIAAVGGSTAFVPSNRTRIYNIAGNSWTEGPAMIESRLGHAQGTLLDGRIIAATGYAGAGTVRTSVELLNPNSGSCPTPGTPTATPTTAPPTATQSGGGTPSATPTCAPQAAGWNPGAAFNDPVGNVRGFGAYFPTTAKFYAIGGRNADTAGSDMLNPRIYDPATDTWATASATIAPDNQVNNMGGGVLTVGGTPVIVVVGGSAAGATTGSNATRYYNPVTDSWTVVTTDPWPPGTANTLPGGYAVVANKLYIFGGFVINTSMSTEIWEYDPAAAAGSRWSMQSAVLPGGRGYIPTVAIGGNIYMAGGSDWDGTTIFDSDQSVVYDPVADTITAIATIPRLTAETRAVNIAGKMWVLGGGRDAPNPNNQVDIYDPIANTWTTGTPFVTARRNFPADTDGAGKIWISGGYAPTSPTNSTEIYSSGTGCPTPGPGTPTNTPAPTNTSQPGASSTPTTEPTTGATETPGITVTPTSCTLEFTDVPPGHTFYVWIRCLACQGIINGYPCGGQGEPCDQDNNPYFRPGNLITRGQLTKIVAISAGYNDPVSGQTFEDVLPGTAFYTYTEQLSGDGVIGGYPCGQLEGEPCIPPDNRPYFRPGNSTTRGQLTKIVALAAGFNDPAPNTFTFTDVPVGHTFHIYVEALLLNRPGVMEGYPCGGPGEPCDSENRNYFRPNNNLTRGQASKIVSNTFFPGCNPPLSQSYLLR